MDLKDKVVIVHGGTSGIGRELVCTLVSKRANVIFSGTNKQKGHELIESLNLLYKEMPHHTIFYNMDVTDWKAQQDIFYFAEKSFNKHIDIVIMVAGILDSSNIIDDCEQDGHYRTLEVNLTATAKFNRLAIQYFLKEKKAGCIINTSSIFGLGPAPSAPLYAASKHAILGLTKSYGNLLRSTNIRINAVAPHFVESPMIPEISMPVINAYGKVPMDSVIEAYLYTITEDSLNGDVINVSHLGRTVEPRYYDPLMEQLDGLCDNRRKDILNALRDHFQ